MTIMIIPAFLMASAMPMLLLVLAKPLIQLAPAMGRHLARDDDIILSGILATQRDRVLAAYRIQGLYHRKTLWRGGWVTLHLS